MELNIRIQQIFESVRFRICKKIDRTEQYSSSITVQYSEGI